MRKPQKCESFGQKGTPLTDRNTPTGPECNCDVL